MSPILLDFAQQLPKLLCVQASVFVRKQPRSTPLTPQHTLNVSVGDTCYMKPSRARLATRRLPEFLLDDWEKMCFLSLLSIPSQLLFRLTPLLLCVYDDA